MTDREYQEILRAYDALSQDATVRKLTHDEFQRWDRLWAIITNPRLETTRD